MANEEHLEILKQGIDVWNKWRSDAEQILPKYRSSPDLSDAYLVRANLHNANLFDVNLSGANLFGANLSNAILDIAKASYNLSDNTKIFIGVAYEYPVSCYFIHRWLARQSDCYYCGRTGFIRQYARWLCDHCGW